MVLHRRRPRVTLRTPVHVTLRVHRDVSSLRTNKRAKIIRSAFVAACSADGFRIVDWSIQGNHLHLIVEADSTAQLSRGMQGFSIRVARGLNRAAGRKGPVFTERYHLHVLCTPAEVRNARAYVLNNYRRHAHQSGRHVAHNWVDPCSSWPWFDGWRDLPPERERTSVRDRDGPPPVAKPRGWMLTTGWRRRGLVSVNETPACTV
jgi:REP element-mobilizing transposase RayT